MACWGVQAGHARFFWANPSDAPQRRSAGHLAHRQCVPLQLVLRLSLHGCGWICQHHNALHLKPSCPKCLIFMCFRHLVCLRRVVIATNDAPDARPIPPPSRSRQRLEPNMASMPWRRHGFRRRIHLQLRPQTGREIHLRRCLRRIASFALPLSASLNRGSEGLAVADARRCGQEVSAADP